MAPSKDYYAVLGVASTASADEIKKQYRRLARKHPPDANASDPQAAERFKEISEAYGVLGDAEKRKQYDDMRRLGAFGFGQGASPRSSRPSGAGSAGGARPGGPGTYPAFGIGGHGGAGSRYQATHRRGGAPPGGR